MTQDLVVITEDDCGTENGMNMRALVEGGEVIESLRDRVLGRVARPSMCCTLRRPLVTPRRARCSTKTRSDALEAAGVDEIKVRTPLTCGTRFGLCAKCYGRDLGRGGLVNGVGGAWA